MSSSQPPSQQPNEQPPPKDLHISSNALKLGAIIAGAAVVCLLLGGVALAATAAATHVMSNGRSWHSMMNDDRQRSGPESRNFGDRGPNGMMRRGPDGGMQALEHGEFVVQGSDGKPTTKRVVRGKVTAVSTTSITVTATDGFAGTFAIDANTAVLRNRRHTAVSAIVVGDTALVSGDVTGAATAAVPAPATATMIEIQGTQDSQLPFGPPTANGDAG